MSSADPKPWSDWLALVAALGFLLLAGGLLALSLVILWPPAWGGGMK